MIPKAVESVRDARTSDDVPATQTLRLVFVAEWRSLWAVGGIRVGAIIAAAVAIIAGAIVFVVLDVLAQEPSVVISTAPVETSSATFGVVFGLVTAVAVGRDSEGRLAFTLLRTPVRSRLFAARALSIAASGMLGAFACSVVVAAISVLFALPESAAAFSLVGAAVFIHTLVSGLVTLISFGLSTIVRRSVAAVLVYLALVVLLPLGLAVGGVALPGGSGAAISAASEWTPLPLLARAIAVSTLPSEGPTGLVIGALGLLGWAAATTVVAHVLFVRRDAP